MADQVVQLVDEPMTRVLPGFGKLDRLEMANHRRREDHHSGTSWHAEANPNAFSGRWTSVEECVETFAVERLGSTLRSNRQVDSGARSCHLLAVDGSGEPRKFAPLVELLI